MAISCRSPNRECFASWLRLLFLHDWVVYAKRPFGGPEHALRYLGDYTHRVALSNHRLVALTDGDVTFRWRDSAHGNKKRLMTLPVDEFLRRFLLHLLPRRFVRIRNFGFLANRQRAHLLPLCFRLTSALREHATFEPLTISSGSPSLLLEVSGLWARRCTSSSGSQQLNSCSAHRRRKGTLDEPPGFPVHPARVLHTHTIRASRVTPNTLRAHPSRLLVVQNYLPGATPCLQSAYAVHKQRTKNRPVSA